MKQPSRSHYNAICGDWVAKHKRTTRNGVGNCSSKTGWISTPERKKDDFEALFKRIFRRKITSPKMAKICWQITVAAFMQPLQYDLRSPVAKDNSIAHAAVAPSNLDAAITMRSAKTELQSIIELRATGSQIAAPKPDGSRRQSEKKSILKHFLKKIFKRKIASAKMEKICWQITVAAFMQPLQYDLRSPAAKDNSITHAAVARSNLDAAITMRSAETELQNTIELRATGSEIAAPKPDLDARAKKKTILKHFLKGFLKRKSLAPKWRKSADKSFVAAFMQPLQYDLRSPAAKDNSITHAAKRGSNTCNPIYTAGTILQLQSTMEFHRQLLHQHHLQSHLQWGNDPRVANHNGIPSATHPPAPLATPFTMRERSYSCKSQWNSVDHTCTKNSWNPIYNAEPIREWSENIRPWSDHTRDRLAPVAPQR